MDLRPNIQRRCRRLKDSARDLPQGTASRELRERLDVIDRIYRQLPRRGVWTLEGEAFGQHVHQFNRVMFELDRCEYIVSYADEAKNCYATTDSLSLVPSLAQAIWGHCIALLIRVRAYLLGYKPLRYPVAPLRELLVLRLYCSPLVKHMLPITRAGARMYRWLRAGFSKQ